MIGAVLDAPREYSENRPVMNWQMWWIYLLTELALSASPGPAVLLVISQSLRAGASRGVWAATGILSANVIWFVLSALGVGAALLATGPWFLALRWSGAAYLVYLALGALAGREALHAEPVPEAARPAVSPGQVWLRGLLLQLSNPKALVFFVALLPQFVDPAEPVEPQIAILGITSLAAEFPILVLYALLAGRAGRSMLPRRFARATDITAGLLLLVAAVSVVLVE